MNCTHKNAVHDTPMIMERIHILLSSTLSFNHTYHTSYLKPAVYVSMQLL